MSVLCPVGHKCWSNTCWQSKSIAVACHCETHKRNTAPPLLQAQLHYTFPLLWLQGARSPFGAWGWAQQCLSAAPSLSCVLVAPCRLFSTVLPVSQSFPPFAGSSVEAAVLECSRMFSGTAVTGTPALLPQPPAAKPGTLFQMHLSNKRLLYSFFPHPPRWAAEHRQHARPGRSVLRMPFGKLENSSWGWLQFLVMPCAGLVFVQCGGWASYPARSVRHSYYFSKGLFTSCCSAGEMSWETAGGSPCRYIFWCVEGVQLI